MSNKPVPRFIAVVFEGERPIGYYAFPARDKEEARTMAEEAFGSEYHLSHRWGERGRMWSVSIEVHQVKESKLWPGVMTDWPDGWEVVDH